MAVKRKDVDLKNQTFKIIVSKGARKSEELRAINEHALNFWREICEGAKPEDYLFSKGLKAGSVLIDKWQISKRWRIHVKEKLGIEADFYSLKHLHTTRVIDKYGRDLAAGLNGHKSNKMNDEHYDLLKDKRALDQGKTIDIKL